MITLLSYPRSGQNLLKHMLGKIGIGVKTSHRITLFNQWPPTGKDKLILIVRDYTECIPRHLASEKIVSAELAAKFFGREYAVRDRASQYLENLVLYDVCPVPKYLIRYEDLITKGKKEFAELAWWLNKDVEMLDWDYEFEESLQKYDSSTLSKGRIDYHKERIIDIDRFHWLMKKTNPYIYDKYLKVYEQDQITSK